MIKVQEVTQGLWACNNCYAVNYDDGKSVKVDNIIEVIIGNNCVRLCEDCFNQLKVQINNLK